MSNVRHRAGVRLSALDSLLARDQRGPWTAAWIWDARASASTNLAINLRRAFRLDAPPRAARLRVTASAEYKLFVNGSYLGHGPVPSNPHFQSFDEYDLTGRLEVGENVIAVAAYSYGVGVHWQHAAPAGVLAELEADGEIVAATDETWRVGNVGARSTRSPRQFWSCGFCETFDLRAPDEGWTDRGFDDSAWVAPAVLGGHPTPPWGHLVPRQVPHLRERSAAPVAAERGAFELRGVHAVRFDPVLGADRRGIVHAETRFHLDRARSLTFHATCDDAFRAFLDGEPLLEQVSRPELTATKLWRSCDELEQVHHGTTLAYSPPVATVWLDPGEHRLTFAVDHGPEGWGLVCAWTDAETGELVSTEPGPWRLAGPVRSSGLADSLRDVAATLSDAGPSTHTLEHAFDYEAETDQATLMMWERRDPPSTVDPTDITLRAGDYAILDLDVVRVGFPELELMAEGGSVLDVGYAQVFFPDRRLRSSNAGALKYADRLYLRAGEQRWEPMQRRTGRYVHLSCRAGTVTLRSLQVRTVGYPADLEASFECSDPELNRIWEVSVRTSLMLMQYGYQDCLKREQGVCNTNQCRYQSLAAAYAFGDHALARKGLIYGVLEQQEDGWFDAHGPSSPNQDEVTLGLYWMLWLRQYHQLTGDAQLVAELFPHGVGLLRYFAKSENEHGLIDGRYLLASRPGQIVYLDDTQCFEPYVGHFHGELVGFNIVYHDALRAAAYLADVLALGEQSAHYVAKADRVRESCNSRFWNETAGRYADWRVGDELSADCHPVHQIAAVYHGICDGPRRTRVMDHIRCELAAPGDDPDFPLQTFGYYFYLLEILFREGCDADAVELLRRYYGSWLDAGATTFGEHYKPAWLAGKERLDYEYEVHGYGTSAHSHFYTNILGVRPLEPGFDRLRVAPKPGGLGFARGTVSTVRGPVEVAWTAGERFDLHVTAPERCHVELDVPPGHAPGDVAVTYRRQPGQSVAPCLETIGCRS